MPTTRRSEKSKNTEQASTYDIVYEFCTRIFSFPLSPFLASFKVKKFPFFGFISIAFPNLIVQISVF
ncbi:hypothetical protein I3842_04G035700 [Carya illinoinensis]|uniref:Uncharacterized protein n=1 Tax=Carya illinoinensis TaxID=32201 RepID=A0A922F8Y1_CARIL|nr:hypothetical protein I3842_04G035700 [Carya illinoinensis]